jgi:hypothetical protein
MKKRHLFKQLQLQNNGAFKQLLFFSTCICRKKFQPYFKIKQNEKIHAPRSFAAYTFFLPATINLQMKQQQPPPPLQQRMKKW